jgi:formylglycine-generating enzyme required for sulfatase activity
MNNQDLFQSGNVWELCWDWYGNYSSSPSNNTAGPSSGSCHVLRRGIWDGVATFCRVADRFYGYPSVSYVS